jgi:hypothetical protein|tara:strand:+ start:195 stop:401 length:207 start_codon:yes stop_codon:yes gene_type:complete
MIEYTLDWKPNVFILINNNHRSEIIIKMHEAFEWSTNYNCRVTKAADSAMDDWVRGLSERPKGAVCYK